VSKAVGSFGPDPADDNYLGLYSHIDPGDRPLTLDWTMWPELVATLGSAPSSRQSRTGQPTLKTVIRTDVATSSSADARRSATTPTRLLVGVRNRGPRPVSCEAPSWTVIDDVSALPGSVRVCLRLTRRRLPTRRLPSPALGVSSKAAPCGGGGPSECAAGGVLCQRTQSIHVALQAL